MIFLRPWALILLLAPWVFVRLNRRWQDISNPWKDKIDKRLRPYVMVAYQGQGGRRSSFLMTVVWCCLSLALAGPAWRVAEVPAVSRQPANVIILDLSPAMTGKNLTQAKLKLYELITQLKGEQAGLVLYGSKGYVAVPITPDLELIRQMIPTLSPAVLPELAERPLAGFEKADELLRHIKAPDGRIVFLTTGALGVDELASAVSRLPWKIGVLGIGESSGAPIPLPNGGFMTDETGKPLLIHLDASSLSQLGVYQAARPDGEDISRLLAETNLKGERETGEISQMTDIYQDQGIWLVVFSLPLMLLLFRRGVVFVLVFGVAGHASADWWARPDQQAYQLEQRAVEAYRQGDFVQAQEKFQNAYNRGNALAQQYKIQEAIEAYEEALQYNPDDEDAAFNKAYLEKQLPPQEGQTSSSPSSSDGSDEMSRHGASSQSSLEQSSSDASGQEPQDSEREEINAQQAPDGVSRPETGDLTPERKPTEGRVVNESTQDNTSISEMNPLEKSEAQSQNSTTEESSLEQPYDSSFDQEDRSLLNRLQKDPSRVLRYRLYQQYQGGNI